MLFAGLERAPLPYLGVGSVVRPAQLECKVPGRLPGVLVNLRVASPPDQVVAAAAGRGALPADKVVHLAIEDSLGHEEGLTSAAGWQALRTRRTVMHGVNSHARAVSRVRCGRISHPPQRKALKPVVGEGSMPLVFYL